MDRDAAHVPAAARSSYPLRPGNRVEPITDGTSALRRICEAVESARHGVRLTVATIERDAPLPDGRGSLFDLLDRAAARGLDVRALFWREPRLRQLAPGSSHFEGGAEDREWLARRGSRFLARWDRLEGGYCQHQTGVLVDAGEAEETAFVGAIDLTGRPTSSAGDADRAHDVHLELRGPAATDVHHDFVQRWNEASEGRAPDGAWPDPDAAGPLEFPRFPSPAAGDVPVQITRTVAAGRYRDGTAAPGHKPFEIEGGEESVLEQYVGAIAAAERSLHVESRAIASPPVVEEIERALVRGVHVVFRVPGNAHPAFVAARRSSRAAPFFARLAALGRFPHFTLVALAATRDAGRYEEIPVPAQVAVVDDAWATVGSTCVAERSFHHDTELNASFWHAGAARTLRRALFADALGRSVDELDELEAFALYRRIALRNCDRRTCWQPLEGLAYAIDPVHYGA